MVTNNANLTVIFNSNSFHQTDSHEFKDGYENHHIKLTIIFRPINYS